MPDKFTVLSAELHRYLVAHSSHRGEPVQRIEAAADEFGDRAAMQIAGDQAALISLLVAATGAERALEVGTFLGYGAVAIARALPAAGRLLCLELEQDFADRARAHLEQAGVADRVTFEVGPALDSLRAIPATESFDFAFIDADKPAYPDYFELTLERLTPGGLIMLDNTLLSGRVLDPEPDDESARAMAALNERLAADGRVEVAMLGIADGVTIARKL